MTRSIHNLSDRKINLRIESSEVQSNNSWEAVIGIAGFDKVGIPITEYSEIFSKF